MGIGALTPVSDRPILRRLFSTGTPVLQSCSASFRGSDASCAGAAGLPRLLYKYISSRSKSDRRGRKKIVTPRDLRRVTRAIEKAQHAKATTNAYKLKAELELPCSIRTVQRACKEAGYHYLVRRQKSVLTDHERSARRSFCLKYAKRSADWWEKHISLFVDGKSWRYHPDPKVVELLDARSRQTCVREVHARGRLCTCPGPGRCAAPTFSTMHHRFCASEKNKTTSKTCVFFDVFLIRQRHCVSPAAKKKTVHILGCASVHRSIKKILDIFF